MSGTGKSNNNCRKTVSAVVAAAGRGTRMGLDTNKQYIDVSGTPVLAITLQKFEKCSRVDEIIIVSDLNEIDYCKKNIVDKYGFKKVKATVAGGDSRQRSVFNGLRHVSPYCGIVLIHDGARPFVDQNSIISCIDTADTYGAACAAVPVKDTIKLADADNLVSRTIDRKGLWHIQTPQAFEYRLIMDAHNRALADGFVGTDDAMLAERSGYKVKLVMSDYFNIKITTREDLIFAESICKMMN